MNKDIIVVLSETGIQISIIFLFILIISLRSPHGAPYIYICVRVCVYVYNTCCTRLHTDMYALFYNNIILL